MLNVRGVPKFKVLDPDVLKLCPMFSSLKTVSSRWFPKIGVPQNGWLTMENPVKLMIWGYHDFPKHPFQGGECPSNFEEKGLDEILQILCEGLQASRCLQCSSIHQHRAFIVMLFQNFSI